MRLTDILKPSNKVLQHSGGCGTCPHKMTGHVPALLNPTKMIIVGGMPGATDVSKKMVLSGSSGQLLRNALRDVGVTEYSVTNVAKCRSVSGGDPKPKVVSCCLNQYGLHEIEPYPLVVLVGDLAISTFYPEYSSSVLGNLAYHPDFPNSRFFSMLHPADVNKGQRSKDLFYKHVDRLGRIFHGATEVPFRMVDGQEFVQNWEAFLKATRVLSLDLETNRLESWEPGGRIKSMAACGIMGNEVYSIEESDPYFPTALKLVAQYLQDPEKQVLGQNIGFDLVWLEELLNFRCQVKFIHDLQALYYQLKGGRHIALKPTVAEELDGYRHLVCWPHKETNPTRLKAYNSEDVWYPKELFLRDFPKLKPSTQKLCLEVLGPSSLVTRRITHAGIYFRSDVWEATDKEFAEAREAAIRSWEEASPEFKRDSYITDKGFRDLDHYIYEIKKYPRLRQTDTGKDAVDEATIKELIRNGASELEFCLAIKGIDKRRSTYILAYPPLVASDRRIHASYHTTSTSTGRLSSSRPNMQNNPRKDKKFKNQIRWLFGAPSGSKFLSGDFSQIELRIAMSLANDPVGLQVYKEGGDIHRTTAMSILGDAPATEEEWETHRWKDARTKAKSANFCLIYGGSPYALQEYALNTFGVMMTDQDAKTWHRGFFDRYRALEPWHMNEVAKLRANRGVVESVTGHVWYYKDWDSPDSKARAHEERSAINSTCQGPAAQLMVRLIYLVQQEFWKRGIKAPGLKCAEIVLTVHDSLSVEVAVDQVEEARAIVMECLHEVEQWASSWFKVPLLLDTEITQVWDLHE